MNKFAYLAALAAVPAMVAPSQAAQFTASQKITICKLAAAVVLVQTLEDNSISMSEKVEVAETLAEGVENFNASRGNLPDDLVQSAFELLSGMSDSARDNFGDRFQRVISRYEANNYYGNARLRNAVQRFCSGFLEGE